MAPKRMWTRKGLALLILTVCVIIGTSWTLAASIVEHRSPASPAGTAVAAVSPPAKPPVAPVKVSPPQGAPAAAGQPTVPEATYGAASPDAAPVDLAPPPSSSPPGPEAPASSAALSEADRQALRLAAFPAQQFSALRLGGNPHAGKRVALTFDDGPVPGWTEKYLEVLREEHVPATFFFVGREVVRDPQLVRAVAAAGHEIGAHSFSHRKLTGLKKPQVEAELWDSGTALYQITNQPVAYFRPPYGASNAGVTQAAKALGLTQVLWNVDPRDWEAPGAQHIVNHVVNHVRPGAVILLHEGKPGTYDALPALIHKLRSQGYEFVTVSQLFGFQAPPAEKRIVTRTSPVSRGRLAATTPHSPARLCDAL